MPKKLAFSNQLSSPDSNSNTRYNYKLFTYLCPKSITHVSP